MANIGMNFDATAVAPNTGAPPPLPTDWYNAMITESEMKQTKDGQGGYLALTLKVMDGPLAGRMFFDRLNLYNQNPVAVEIAQKQLSAICHAVGVFQVQDSAVLHGKPLMARVVERPAEGGYDASNDVKAYAKVGEKVSANAGAVPAHGYHPEAPPVAPPTFAPPSAAPTFTPPATSTPPWSGASTAAPGNTPPWAK